MQLDFLSEAFAAQTKAALAKFVYTAPRGPTLTNEFNSALTDFFEFDQTIPVFFTKVGAALLTTANLRNAGIKSCLLVTLEALTHQWLSHIQGRYDSILVARLGHRGTDPVYALNDLNNWVASARVITGSADEPVVKKPLRFRYKDFSINGLNVYRSANCLPTLLKREEVEMISEEFLGKEAKTPKNLIAAELFLKDQLTSNNHELSVDRYWEQIIREPVVPFEYDERRSKLRYAYDYLSEYFADL